MSGSIQNALKNNKNLLRRTPLFKDFKDQITSNNDKTSLAFKKVEKEALEKIKEKIRAKAKKDKIKSVYISMILFVVCSVLFYFLLHDFSIDFSLFSRRR